MSIASDIAALKPGEWYGIPDTDLINRSVWNPNGCQGTGPQYICEYSGGDLDTKLNRLLVRGGGHGSYDGNEIYAFNLSSGASPYQWERISAQSSKTWTDGCRECTYDCSEGYYGDGLPQAFHTWDIIAYHPLLNALIEPTMGAHSGGGACYTNAHHDHSIRYDLGSNAWSTETSVPIFADEEGGNFVVTLIDSNGNIWCFQEGGSQQVWEMKYSDMIWYARTADNQSGLFGDWGAGCGAIDTARNIAVVLGDGYFAVWDLATDTSPVRLTTAYTGPSDLVDAVASGIAWDSNSGLFVGWVGLADHTADVYSLEIDPDREIYKFTKVIPAATNSVTPTARNADGSYGPFGRWSYSPKDNVFILMNLMTENVKVYRFSNSRKMALVATG